MRFRRSNDVGRRSYSIPSQARYTGGRPYRSFGRAPIKYSLGRSPSGSIGQTRRTPYGRVITLRTQTDRIPGDRNYVRIRQIAPVTMYRAPMTISHQQVDKHPIQEIPEFIEIAQLGGGVQSPQYYVEPRLVSVQRSNKSSVQEGRPLRRGKGGKRIDFN